MNKFILYDEKLINIHWIKVVEKIDYENVQSYGIVIKMMDDHLYIRFTNVEKRDDRFEELSKILLS